MKHCPDKRNWLWKVSTLLLIGGVTLRSAIPQAPATEGAAYAAALAQTAPAARIGSLEKFLTDFPSGTRYTAGRQHLLETYLTYFPERVDRIHAIASAGRQAASPGLDRWIEEAHLADLLANAGEHGTDLADAEAWAEDAVHSLTETTYAGQLHRMRTLYGLPALTLRQRHLQFGEDRATCLAALANVRLRQARPAAAAPLLAEAAHLDALSSEVYRLQGELALTQGQKTEALNDLLHASALGILPPPWNAQQLQLFEQLEHGDAEALQTRIDAAYRAMYPPLFHLSARHLPAGGHPVLLELFTGSDCAPCAGPDLALDSLLDTYNRADLIALEYDEHIPRPDPLTTPASVAQAAFYGVNTTPAAFLDGQALQILGASRGDVGNIAVGFADGVESAASLPSGLHFSLSAAWANPGELRVTTALAQETLNPSSSGDSTGNTSLQSLQHAILNVALVEDGLRYPGQNGIRFHRMVVRALEQSPALSALAGAAHPSLTTFKLTALQTAQRAYLEAYEAHNDRFGTFRFRTTDIPLHPDHLAIVAWVQDPASKHVLQSAYLAVAPSQ